MLKLLQKLAMAPAPLACSRTKAQPLSRAGRSPMVGRAQPRIRAFSHIQAHVSKRHNAIGQHDDDHAQSRPCPVSPYAQLGARHSGRGPAQRDRQWPIQCLLGGEQSASKAGGRHPDERIGTLRAQCKPQYWQSHVTARSEARTPALAVADILGDCAPPDEIDRRPKPIHVEGHRPRSPGFR